MQINRKVFEDIENSKEITSKVLRIWIQGLIVGRKYSLSSFFESNIMTAFDAQKFIDSPEYKKLSHIVGKLQYFEENDIIEYNDVILWVKEFTKVIDNILDSGQQNPNQIDPLISSYKGEVQQSLYDIIEKIQKYDFKDNPKNFSKVLSKKYFEDFFRLVGSNSNLAISHFEGTTILPLPYSGKTTTHRNQKRALKKEKKLLLRDSLMSFDTMEYVIKTNFFKELRIGEFYSYDHMKYIWLCFSQELYKYGGMGITNYGACTNNGKFIYLGHHEEKGSIFSNGSSLQYIPFIVLQNGQAHTSFRITGDTFNFFYGIESDYGFLGYKLLYGYDKNTSNSLKDKIFPKIGEMENLY